MMREAFLALVLLSVMAPSGFADAGGALPAGWSPGWNPDSPLWTTGLAIERVQIVFTGDPARKAEMAMHFREVRLNNSEAMVRTGKLSEALKATQSYSDYGRELASDVNGAQARPDFSQLLAKIQAHQQKAQERAQAIVQATTPGAQAQVKEALERSQGDVEKARGDADAKAKEGDRLVKEWLRNQERAYGMDGGISLVAIYEGLTQAGKVPEGQLNHAVKWYNTHYTLPQSLNGKTFMVAVTKNGAVTDTVSGKVMNGALVLFLQDTRGDITLTVPSENIPTYLGHMMANDRLAMAGDLREIGAGKDLVALAGLI